MTIKSFKEFKKEMQHKEFKELSPNAVGGGEFDTWLHEDEDRNGENQNKKI